MGDQDPAGSAPIRLPRPKTPGLFAVGTGTRKGHGNQVGVLETSAAKGIFAASLYPALGILGSGLKKRKEKQKGERQTGRLREADDPVLPTLHVLQDT